MSADELIGPEADRWTDRLIDDGYCVIPGAIDIATVAALNADLDARFEATPWCEGDFYGPRTKRFGSLLVRSSHASDFVMHELVLAIAARVLGSWCDRIALNLTQAIEIHEGALPQFPHRDQDMWGGDKGTQEYLLNVMWPLGDFTADNGATLLWPRSHRLAPDARPSTPPVAAEMGVGDVLLFLGSTLHGGGGNAAPHPRRGMIVSYCLGWLRPFENQWLVYPPHVARAFDPELAGLIGYSLHRPNLGNVEGQCPSRLLAGGPDVPLAACDALRPDQAEALAAFVAEQRQPD